MDGIIPTYLHAIGDIGLCCPSRRRADDQRRGPLIHQHRIENGLIAEVEFIILTVHNSLAIERALKVAAQRYITPEHVAMELERAVDRVVRAFDPRIACATH